MPIFEYPAVVSKEARITEFGSSFAKVLRSYQTGGITYSDFLGHVQRFLTAGESPAELLEVLRRRQLIEPLPDFAHAAVARLLDEPAPTAAEESAALSSSSALTPRLEPDDALTTPVMPAPRVALAEELDDPELDQVTPPPPPPPPPPSVPPKSVPAESAPSERTMVIPRGGVVISDYEPPPPGDAVVSRLEDRPFAVAAAATRHMDLRTRALWLGAAFIVILILWLYRHSATVARAPDRVPAPVGNVTTTAPPSIVAAAPGDIIQDCPTCPRMLVLPVGRFLQGSRYDDRDALPAEKPQHVVVIRHSMAMAMTELTVLNFREFVATSKRELKGCEVYDGEWRYKADSSWQDPGFTQGADHPVTCVSWNDAVAYAEWLSAKTGHHYRLPSASEWEFAARSASDSALPWSPGQQTACENANVADRTAARRYPKWSVFACKDGYVNTAPVGSFKANAFGIHDMLGNVLEWTEDCWHDDYVKAPIDGSARMDGDCSEHELRGGSWFSSPAFVRLAYRNHFATEYRSATIGVRLVRDGIS